MKINFGKLRTLMTWITNLLIKGRELGLWTIGYSLPVKKTKDLK